MLFMMTDTLHYYDRPLLVLGHSVPDGEPMLAMAVDDDEWMVALVSVATMMGVLTNHVEMRKVFTTLCLGAYTAWDIVEGELITLYENDGGFPEKCLPTAGCFLEPKP